LDHDCYIPTTDLKRAIRDSAFSFGLNPDEVVTMISNIDQNGDKLIDVSEFCTLVSIFNRYLSLQRARVNHEDVGFKAKFFIPKFSFIALLSLYNILLGLPLELVHQWRVIVVYLAGVLCGSLLVSAVDPHVFLAGASGGVYALLAAHQAELIMNWREMEFNWIRAIILVILIGSDTAVSVYQRYFVDRVDRVSYVSHIGGFVAGNLLGVVILRNFRRHKWEARLWWASLVAFVFFIVICIVLIIAPDIIPGKRQYWPWLRARFGAYAANVQLDDPPPINLPSN
uniref:EF-hand domain-containing protein n=1 Tax=Haemonchus placei TaxID=6290 RepID=A0A0N4VYK5_HAEPC